VADCREHRQAARAIAQPTGASPLALVEVPNPNEKVVAAFLEYHIKIADKVQTQCELVRKFLPSKGAPTQ
jgi:hypothetical protein